MERFARVACPARGTLLASRRLDLYAKFLFNVFNLIPLIRESGIATVLKKVVLVFLDQRADPRLVPGLEAQMPESPFINLLNTSSHRLEDRLGVIAGDVQGSGILKRISVAASDLFFRQNHDFVVHTAAMSQGVRRLAAGVSSHQGSEYSHSAYFSVEPCRDRVTDLLLADEMPATFSPLEPEGAGAARSGPPRRATGDVPVVIVVPDLFGTTLVRNAELIWPEPASLARAGLDALSPEAPGVEPGELLDVYEPAIARLSGRYNVVPYPYDWRRSLASAATGLSEEIRSRLGATGQPVHLLAHGAGGIVARVMAAGHGEVWSEAASRQSRMVLLGSPHGGWWFSVGLLDGSADLAYLMGLVTQATASQVAAAFGGFQSLVETLPDGGTDGAGEAAVWSPQWWRELGSPLTSEQLAAAMVLRTTIASGQVENSVSIVGRADVTPIGIPADGGLEWHGTRRGDGRVDWQPGPPEPTYYAEASHGGLPRSGPVLSALEELFKTGVTSLLSRAQPIVDPGPPPIEDVRGRVLFPTARELADIALGLVEPRLSADAMALELRVEHGDLRFADLPIIVGHIMGTPLRGAELTLDRISDDVISSARRLGVYAGEAGTSQLFSYFRGEERHVCAVVNMGEIGEFTPTVLREGVADACLRLVSIRLHEAQRSDEQINLGIAPVLIGAGTGGLSVDDSVSAIIEGVITANRRLVDEGLIDHIRVTRVQVTESYEGLAIAAQRAALRLAEQYGEEGSQERLSVAPYILVGAYPKRGQPDPVYHEGEWRTITVEAVRSTTDTPMPTTAEPAAVEAAKPATDTAADTSDELVDLVFTSVGARARAERVVSSSQRQQIEQLISSAVNSAEGPEQPTNTLYELLFPPALKASLEQPTNLMFVLDPEAAHYPWELLATRIHERGIQPIASRTPMLRRLRIESGRDQVRPGTGTTALVIGDPPTSHFPRLEGARQEALLVAQLLEEAGWDVTRLIPSGPADTAIGPDDIVNALFAADYRLVHIAAHGYYDSLNLVKSGVVIGDGRFLTTLEFSAMSTVPDLVFLNCCHLGRFDDAEPEKRRAGAWGNFHHLAASVSRQLIGNGVRGIVAAGWAVNDEAAKDFAGEFYRQMLDGTGFGDAVFTARRAIYRRHRGSNNTWAAYQCYGPPALYLTRPSRRPRPKSPVSAGELSLWLQDILERSADVPSVHESDLLAGELDSLIDNASSSSLLDGRCYYVAGQAYFDLGRYEAAVKYMEQARQDSRAESPLKLLEQLADAQIRLAVEMTMTGSPLNTEAKAAAKELTHDALANLDTLINLTKTRERYSLRGAYWKRRSLLGPLGFRTSTSLARSAAEYQQAYEHVSDESNAYYPGLNWAMLRWLRGDPVQSSGAIELAALVDASESSAVLAAKNDSWARITRGDLALLRGLVAGDLASQVDAVAAHYRDAFGIASSLRERKTVEEHLGFVRCHAPDEANRQAIEALIGTLFPAAGDTSEPTDGARRWACTRDPRETRRTQATGAVRVAADSSAGSITTTRPPASETASTRAAVPPGPSPSAPVPQEDTDQLAVGHGDRHLEHPPSGSLMWLFGVTW